MEINRENIEPTWIKINPDHRPAVGHAIYSTFNPEEGGFTVESESNNDGAIADEQKVMLYIPYNLISVTNFHVWDRHRENNYEIDDIYSN